MQLGEVQITIFDLAFLCIFHDLWKAVNRRDVRQQLAAFNFRLNTCVHQVVRHFRTQTFERVICVHRHTIAWAFKRNFKLFSQGPIRVQRDDAICQNQRLIHIVSDQNAGLFVSVPNAFDFVS